MVKIRIIPCLDVKDGRVVKGINFLNLIDAGDPVEQAKHYSDNGADEICFLDISASLEKRKTMINIVEKTADARKYELDHLYQTLDTPDSLHIAQDPHFDRIPTLKFMLYVNDMKKSNGAFIVSPGSHHWVNQNFKKRGTFNNERF